MQADSFPKLKREASQKFVKVVQVKEDTGLNSDIYKDRNSL